MRGHGCGGRGSLTHGEVADAEDEGSKEAVGVFICSEQLKCISQVNLRFLGVLRCWESLLFDLISYLSVFSPMSDDHFYFPFFVVSDDLGCRICVVWPVGAYTA